MEDLGVSTAKVVGRNMSIRKKFRIAGAACQFPKTKGGEEEVHFGGNGPSNGKWQKISELGEEMLESIYSKD